MDFLKKLGQMFAPQAPASDYSYWVNVRCSRCGEEVKARINLANDLSMDYNDHGTPNGYRCRKVLMGENRCFQKIEIDLTFDMRKRVKEREISGGVFLD